jgi:uncharacterized protein YlbG (UPF0298 family)
MDCDYKKEECLGRVTFDFKKYKYTQKLCNVNPMSKIIRKDKTLKVVLKINQSKEALSNSSSHES